MRRFDPPVTAVRAAVARALEEDLTPLGDLSAALLPEFGLAIDLCCGTGAVGSHLQLTVPTATSIGIDCDLRAARCARRNRVSAIVGDLAAPLRAPRAVDLVTAVAPYVPTGEMQFLPTDVQRFEPRAALDGGADGLALVRRVVAAGGDLLRPGGWLLIEVGGDHDVALEDPIAAAGFDHVESWCDEDGDLRGIAAQLG